MFINEAECNSGWTYSEGTLTLTNELISGYNGAITLKFYASGVYSATAEVAEYSILTAAGLNSFLTTTDISTSGDNKLFILGADIDYSDYGSGSIAFYSTFDGKGHTISNFSVDSQNAGLFVTLYTCTIKNLAVVNAKINSANTGD